MTWQSQEIKNDWAYCTWISEQVCEKINHRWFHYDKFANRLGKMLDLGLQNHSLLIFRSNQKTSLLCISITSYHNDVGKTDMTQPVSVQYQNKFVWTIALYTIPTRSRNKVEEIQINALFLWPVSFRTSPLVLFFLFVFHVIHDAKLWRCFFDQCRSSRCGMCAYRNDVW